LVGSNQGNYFENATACSKRTLKTTVATQLNEEFFRLMLLSYIILLSMNFFSVCNNHTNLTTKIGKQIKKLAIG